MFSHLPSRLKPSGGGEVDAGYIIRVPWCVKLIVTDGCTPHNKIAGINFYLSNIGKHRGTGRYKDMERLAVPACA